MNSPDQSAPSSARVGYRLVAAREKWGLSVEDAAEYLNLSVATIKALEDDAYNRLPGITFAKGYLRAYAKFLKLDHEQILEHANFESEEPREIPIVRSSLKRGSRRAKQKKRNAAGVLLRLFLFFCVLAGLAWLIIDLWPGSGIDKIQEILQLPDSMGLDDTDPVIER